MQAGLESGRSEERELRRVHLQQQGRDGDGERWRAEHGREVQDEVTSSDGDRAVGLPLAKLITQ